MSDELPEDPAFVKDLETWRRMWDARRLADRETVEKLFQLAITQLDTIKALRAEVKSLELRLKRLKHDYGKDR